jgi:HK97 family phage portal protein
MGMLARMFAPLERRATLGQGFTVSQTPPAWVKGDAGYDTAVGRTVAPDDALTLTAVYACVRILAETLASLPLVPYRRLGERRGKRRATEHYLYPILHDIANPEMTSFTLRETLMGHVALRGNAFAEIELNRRGEVLALWPLRPDKMERVKREGGRLKFYYRVPAKEGGGLKRLDQERVLHVKGLSSNGIVGYDPITLARQALGLALGTEEFGARFFGNGARPGGVLKHPGRLTQEAYEKLRDSWEDRHKGLSQAHRTAILEEGLEFQEIGLAPEAAQFLETRKFQNTEIARFYRIPPHMLADLERATFSNIEHQSLEFVIHTMRPWLVRWEQELNRTVIAEGERGEIFVEFLVDGLLRGDIANRYTAYAQGRQNGWLSANDIREKENMNPVAGGDVLLVPLNMIPASEAGFAGSMEGGEGAGTAPVQEGEGREADSERLKSLLRMDGSGESRSARGRQRLALSHVRLYEDVAGRILRREINDVGNAARKWFKARDAVQFSVWLERFYRDHIGFVATQMLPLAMSYGQVVAGAAQEEIGEPAEMTPEIERYIESYVDTYAARHAGISEVRIREVVRKAVEADEHPVDALELAFRDWEEKRPAEVARWESVRFNNALAVGVYLMARKTMIRWVASGKSCEYCNDLSGRVVGIKEWFIPSGAEFQPEGAERPLKVRHNVGHPPAHNGCDCMVVAG